MTPHDDATIAQIRAADPAASTWLSANAGSGKTRVLTNRVARLLLRGVRPENVLCLTFTKAAASEMQNRLFGTLGSWAMLDDAALRAALADIGEDAPGDLRQARRLFAGAIEAPGGLKIQTIHSFCSSLLRAFPLEAGVTPHFTEMDDDARDRLLADLGDGLASLDPDGAFSGLAAIYSGDEPLKLLAGIASAREEFEGPAPDPADLLEAYGAPRDLTEAALLDHVDAPAPFLGELIRVLGQGSSRDQTQAAILAPLADGGLTVARLSLLERVMLDQTRFEAKRGTWPTKGTREKLDKDALDDLMDRVERARPWRLALEAAQKTHALHRFARAFLPRYQAEKLARGLLDFDDLILGAGRLLERSDAAEWVLYRLDGGIDHILVDEAQDTSPAQWRVIELLTRELGAGAGARDVERSFFVVGDKKQSIYSFQGADAAAFTRMQGFFGDRLRPFGGLKTLPLSYSFRSAPAILKVVDQSFPPDEDVGLGRGTLHRAFFERLPGRVDLWPLVPAPEVPEHADWTEPVDGVAQNHQAVVLANRIADELHRMIRVDRVRIPKAKRPLDPPEWRPVTEGDILILVQGRGGVGELFQGLIRACKARGLAIAGADRLRLSAELAVRDLQALLSFLALPEDSLSLAAVLKSPLFGWSEDDLFRLAHGRKERFLWRTLQDRRDRYPGTLAVLEDLRDKADFLRPFELLERMLIRHDGRRKLLSRLGEEAEDGIDELLTQALTYERSEVPDLTGFLAWLDSGNAEIKRQTDSTANAIQVMTVHGAKGLERPVVILPDTMRARRNSDDALISVRGEGVHWAVSKAQRPPGLTRLVDLKAEGDAEERNRLLYVAMTRAESWLIVCGAEAHRDPDDAWYARVSEGMERADAAAFDMPTGPGLRLEDAGWDEGPGEAGETAAPRAAPLPGWAERPAPPEPDVPATLAPSSLPGEKALPGADGALAEDAAKRRGRMLHRLLEHLPDHPVDTRMQAVTAILSAGEDRVEPGEAVELAETALRLLADPALAHVFAPGTLAEVEISADLPGIGRRIRGAIDRLIVEDHRVTAVDFKTNAGVPDSAEAVPIGILRQMAAYHVALGQVYPDREVQVAILWTSSGKLMPLSHEIVMNALGSAAIS